MEPSLWERSRHLHEMTNDELLRHAVAVLRLETMEDEEALVYVLAERLVLADISLEDRAELRSLLLNTLRPTVSLAHHIRQKEVDKFYEHVRETTKHLDT